MKRKTKRIVLAFTAIAVLVVLVLAGSTRWVDSQRAKQRIEQQRLELKPPEPVPVEIKKRSLPLRKRYTAEAAPWRTARIPSEVSGRVVEVLVEPGTRVETGAPLIRLDEIRARIAVDEAAAREAEAVRLLNEARRLSSSQVVSETVLESAATEQRVSAARLADARELLERHTIKAPFPGVVNARSIDVGEAVTPGETVVTLVDLTRLRIRFQVETSDLSAFPPGKQVDVLMLGGGGERRGALVVHVAGAADPSSRLFLIEAELQNRNDALPGGIQAVVESEIARFDNCPVVPVAAVRFSGARPSVLKSMPNGPEIVELTLGPEIEGFYPVFEGLAEGDRVFIR